MTKTTFRTILLGSLFLALFTYPFIFLPFRSDPALYAYFGNIINQGGLPYSDAWNVQPPVVYYVFSLAINIIGYSAVGIRLFDLIYMLDPLCAIAKLGQLLYDQKTGILSALALGILYFWTTTYWNLTQCESMMIFPMILTVYFCCLALKKQNNYLFLLSGFSLGIVFMTKTPGTLMGGAVGLYLIVEAFREGKRGLLSKVLSQLTLIVAGFLIYLTLFLLYFYINDGLSDILYTLFVYNVEHARSGLSLKINYGHLALPGFLRRYLFVLIPAFLALFIKKERGQWPENVLLYGWALSVIAAFFMQGKYFHYHMLPVMAPLSILGARGLVRLWTFPFWNKDFLLLKRKILLAIILGGFLFVAIRPHLLLSYKITRALIRKNFTSEQYALFSAGEGFSLEKITKVSQYINKNSAPTDSILVWSFEPLIYFLAKRNAPTRFIFNSPLIAEFNPKKNQWRKELVNDLTATPPKYIIVSNNDFLTNHIMANTNQDSATLLKEFSEMYFFLEQFYTLDKKIGSYLIYSLISHSSQTINIAD